MGIICVKFGISGAVQECGLLLGPVRRPAFSPPSLWCFALRPGPRSPFSIGHRLFQSRPSTLLKVAVTGQLRSLVSKPLFRKDFQGGYDPPNSLWDAPCGRGSPKLTHREFGTQEGCRGACFFGKVTVRYLLDSRGHGGKRGSCCETPASTNALKKLYLPILFLRREKWTAENAPTAKG